MTRLGNGTWVLVADGEKALFLENEGDGDYPVLRVRRKEEQENLPDREQSTDRPGRVQQSAVQGGSAYQETDWHALAKERFADELAAELYKRAHRREFDRIVLVAPPAILGELRSELHQEVRDRIVGEIPKTLTNHPVDEIERIVKAELATG